MKNHLRPAALAQPWPCRLLERHRCLEHIRIAIGAPDDLQTFLEQVRYPVGDDPTERFAARGEVRDGLELDIQPGFLTYWRGLNPWWFALAVFVAVNLLQSAFTKWCLLESILLKLGVPDCPCREKKSS